MRPRWPARLCLLLLVATGWSPAGEAQQPPNILVFIADDASWSDFGAYGNPHVRTPNLDALAAAGVVFDRAFLTTASCSPSRISAIPTPPAPRICTVRCRPASSFCRACLRGRATSPATCGRPTMGPRARGNSTGTLRRPGKACPASWTGRVTGRSSSGWAFGIRTGRTRPVRWSRRTIRPK
ncbi:MAG: sulfatase-like hydrolase/transferase [Acidobacteria bacterium]|nr:sulfatase-like hydrolase/transferase [Acidobacteriota bacterium]